MMENDPENVRLDAAKALTDILVSSSEATNGKVADLVTVVDFAGEGDAEVIYGLGDPSGAAGPIAGSTVRGGTFIGGGIKAATDELAKEGSTANRTGIVVLTDGEDYPPELVTQTISEIERAGQQGIRVSFGFLQVLPPGTDVSSGSVANQDPRIQSAILATGGSMATINTAENYAAFLAQLLSAGITSNDAQGGELSLFSGLTTAAQLASSGSNTFKYDATTGEQLNVTVSAVDNSTLTGLKATLRDVGANTEISSAETDDTGVAFLEYTAQADTELEVAVTATDPNARGIFSVGLKSSKVLDSECLNSTSTATNTTSTSNATTKATGSPTNPLFPLYTGGAGSLHGDGAYHLSGVVSLVVGSAIAAMVF